MSTSVEGFNPAFIKIVWSQMAKKWHINLDLQVLLL